MTYNIWRRWGHMDPQDRIDRIYHSGPGVRASAAAVFTTTVENTTGDIVGNAWPSDHAAVVMDSEIGNESADFA